MDNNNLVVEEYSWTKIFFIIFIITGVIGFFGYSYYVKSQNQQNAQTEKNIQTITPTKAVIKEIKPTSIPTPSINRKDFKIQVLNGSNKVGIAGKTQVILEKLGYQNVDIGNADNSDYQNTVISVKDNNSKLFDLLIQDLKTTYKIRSQAGKLDVVSDFDAEIIIGNN